MAGELSPILDGIPVVASSTARAALYPSPTTNQRVHNLQTSAVERYNGVQWVTDFSQAGLSVYSVKDPRYGAAGDATTDDTTAIQNAATAAGTTGLLYFPPGDYKTTSTITVTSAVLADGQARIFYYGTGDGLHVGDGSGFVQTLVLALPQVVNANKSDGGGWTGSGVGILFRRMFNCQVHIPYVAGFVVGAKFYGISGDGCDYNTVRISFLRNNKVNLQLDSVAGAGWCNQNLFLGGRLAHAAAEGTNVSGVRQVQILGASNYPTTNVDVLNNNVFVGLSLEGDVPQYHVEVRGTNHLFDHCRWEASPPKFLSYGAAAFDNWIRSGYGAEQISHTRTGGGGVTRIDSRDGFKIGAAPGTSIATFINYNSDASFAVAGSSVDQDVNSTNIASTYTWGLTARALHGKQSGDTNDRVLIDYQNGKLLCGDATTAPKWGITGGGLQVKVQSFNSDQALGGGGIVLVDASGGVRQYGLPAASAAPGVILTVVKIDSSANNVQVNRAGSDLINGATSKTTGTTQYSKFTITNDGASAWYVIG